MWKAFLAASLAAGVDSADVSRGQSSRKMFRPLDANLVQPFNFDQQLLICNAYPSAESVTVQKNEHETLAGDRNAIPFRECRYMPTHVQKQDKLVFGLTNIELQGTFEVGELPSTDATLLLVLKKRKASPMVTFSSFALPAASNKKDAQIAVIDASLGNSSYRLKVEDHPVPVQDAKKAPKELVAKREEELNFNRVYTIESGAYDASVVQSALTNSSVVHLEPSMKTLLRLAGSGNYVVLNTGDGDTFPQELRIFPDAPLPSFARPRAVGFLSTCLTFVAAMLSM